MVQENSEKLLRTMRCCPKYCALQDRSQKLNLFAPTKLTCYLPVCLQVYVLLSSSKHYYIWRRLNFQFIADYILLSTPL
jgi:hypothetical protein